MIPVKVLKIPGKGRGVVSVKKVKKFTLIEECPVLLFKVQENEKHLLEGYSFRWDKNQIALALGNGSLYNHSSNPNLLHLQNKKNKTVEFYSARDIKAGEELCFKYSDNLWFVEK
jgi:SET domain-containing protein